MTYLNHLRGQSMIRFLLPFLLLPLLHAGLSGQKKPPLFFAAAEGGKVYILVTATHGAQDGFNVYRKTSGASERVPLNPVPVRAVEDPAQARDMLGGDYTWLVRALRCTDAVEALQRLKSDPALAVIYSFASPRVALVAGRLFVDDNVPDGGKLTYRIEILGRNGSSIAAGEQELTMQGRKPRAPSGIVLEPGDGEIKVSWQYPAYTGRPDDIVVGFNLYRMVEGGKPERINQQILLRQEGLTYRHDTELENDRRYTYDVRAVDFLGRESDPSESLSAIPKDTTPPAMPVEVQTVAEEGAIAISWRMNLETDASHYDVYKGAAMEGTFRKINAAPLPVDQSRFVDSDVMSGPLFYYRIKAIDKAGNESEFSNVAVGHPLDSSPPDPPSEVTATVARRIVTIRWRPPSQKDLYGYYVFWKETGQDFMKITGEALDKKVTEYTDAGFSKKGLTAGKNFVYGVASVDNAFNVSGIAEVRVAIPDDEAPLPPFSGYARSTPGGFVQIGWQPSLSADVRSYRIYRGETKGRSSVLKETANTIFQTTDSSVAPGKEYYFEVSAIDSAGNESSRTGKAVVVPRDLAAPAAPEGIRATVEKAGVRVSWTAVAVPDLTGYNIYRSELPNSKATKLNKTLQTQTEFFDRGGKSGWYYRISSVDSSGNENAEGAAVEARPDGRR